MVEELKPSFAYSARPVGSRPKSGEYWGSSEESDDGDQAVRSTITFEATGAVRGHGVDGEDGAYKITNGVWGKRDEDKEGEVVVGGFYASATGKIEARFRSSRGVRGRFILV